MYHYKIPTASINTFSVAFPKSSKGASDRTRRPVLSVSGDDPTKRAPTTRVCVWLHGKSIEAGPNCASNCSFHDDAGDGDPEIDEIDDNQTPTSRLAWVVGKEQNKSLANDNASRPTDLPTFPLPEIWGSSSNIRPNRPINTRRNPTRKNSPQYAQNPTNSSRTHLKPAKLHLESVKTPRKRPKRLQNRPKRTGNPKERSPRSVKKRRKPAENASKSAPKFAV